MKFFDNFMWLCVLHCVLAVEITIGSSNDKREGRKLFGGYRITPRFCKPTRKGTDRPIAGPSICMFNHECIQRNGQVVGACMDGFLFGACCQLPAGTSGELLETDPVFAPIDGNTLAPSSPRPAVAMTSSVDITSNGVSQITQSLLGPNILPTAEDDEMVQIGADPAQLFGAIGAVTHPAGPETVVINAGSDDINPGDFKLTTKRPDDRRTTPKYELPISISNAPSVYTPSPGGGLQRPAFRPKPLKPSDNDKYVLVPTISHSGSTSKPNKTQEIDSIVNILQMLNGTTTTKRPTYSVTAKTTSRKPPSTSYIFSTTVKPRRTTSLFTKTTVKKSKPTKSSNKKTTLPYGYSTTQRPAHSTFANSPDAFLTTKRPPSTSYVYSVAPTRRPTVDTHIAGPGFSVTSNPAQYSSYPSAAPTVIVLGPVTEEGASSGSPLPITNEVEPAYTLIRPNSRPPPPRKPVNSVTINNHVTQNIYSTSERPLPTVLITPKPTVSQSSSLPTVDASIVESADSSPDQLSNFPPVRNPNLNMSNPIVGDEDITTPIFVEDDALDEKMESFVNKIIQGLQEPFDGLRDVVYNKNKTSTTGGTTTKKPVKKQGTTTRRPATSTTVRTTTRRPTTRRTTTKRTVTTTRRTKTTRRPTTTTTTTESFIEEDNSTQTDYEQYRHECGVRPLLRSGRIVGGKGATFGEFPWQVLVRESTWLGLFTKNKCGGVLIGNKYVMTAAHCQPGFLASLVAVFGEFDISGDLESRRPLSRNVKRVIVHRKYDAATFENDLALLELEQPVRFDAHIIPICLPNESEDFTGRMATVTGWGRLKYGGGVPSVLQEVQVPIMENVVCQEMFRTAGHSKVILESFLCAGYANGQKDSCEGDSGGPLVLQRPDGRYQLAGTVSHGIKCAAPYLPGVYMRTTYYKPWIEAVTGIH